MEITTAENISVKNWLKKVMKKNNLKAPDVFGVPLHQSLQAASTYIAYEDKDTVIGYIPIVVAKCGSFLKDQGLYVEGVFRKSGSAKRVGELQQHFNTSSDYGKYLNWKLGYTVHDAANCLRRFLNYLPEPVIVFSLYEPFRNIIQTNIGDDEDEFIDEKLKFIMIQEFQILIDQLPIINQYLLFYLLDLLALFSRYAKYTKMNSIALSSVFTPGILLSPDHAMNPSQYKLSQRVVRFLIENQTHFHLPKNQYPPQLTLPSSSIKKTPSIIFNDKQQLLRANTVPVQKNRIKISDDSIQVITK